jgi:hypothetical protein
VQAILNAVVAREVTARLCTGNNIIRTEGLGEWEPELRLVRPEVLSEDISPALKDIKAAGYTCTLPSEASPCVKEVSALRCVGGAHAGTCARGS